MSETKTSYEFQAEIKKLLNILSKSLYQHKEIFLRELISNSVDALKKIKFILLTNRDVADPEAEQKIEIYFNEEEKIITIRDTGVGMIKEELINDLGTIAGSGTEKFAAQLEEMKKEGKQVVDLDIIGQFGIGFYSVFMVADKVKVITNSYKKDEPAYAWESDGTGNFTIEPADKKERGTDIILYINEDSEEFLNQYRLEAIIKKYSNFVPFPIYVSELQEGELPTEEKEKEKIEAKKEEVKTEEGEKEEKKEEEEEPEEQKPVNQTEPIWKKQKNDITDEEYKNFYNYIANRYDDYLDVINYQVDGQVRFRSLLYIPGTASKDFFQPDTEYGLSLYSKNVMIMDNCEEIVPRWMRFVKGILESEDIPLNISRETIQANRKLRKMGDALIKKFLRELKSMAEKDKEKYQTFWNEFGDFIKEGIVTDPIRQKRLKDLLRFHTSKTEEGELIGLKEYVDRMKEGQEKIFYLVGENMELAKRSPHLGFYEKEELEVILFDRPIDNFLMMNMQNYTQSEGEGDDKETKVYEFMAIDTAEKKEEEESEEDEEKKKTQKKKDIPEKTQKFLEKVKDLLGDKIIDATTSERLYGNPCRLANPPDGPTSSQQKAMRYWTQTQVGEQFQIPKKILEFNPEHELIKELIELNAKNAESSKLELVITQLFENSLLTEGDLPDPTAMVPRINQILEMLITGKDPETDKKQ